MKIRTFFLVIGLIAVAAFVALNWSAIMTPTTLSLGVAAVQAPLGFLLLALITLFTALFLVALLYSRASGLFKERNHSREMQVTQKLADNAETSRFTELRELMGTGLQRQSDLYAASTATVLAKLEQLGSDLSSAMKA
ncbi:MAG: LapA family protein [bacterium]|nr:LapA family protein [bacterium]